MSSLLDDLITNPAMDAYDYSVSVQRRPAGFGEYLWSKAASGWQSMFIKQGIENLREPPAFETVFTPERIARFARKKNLSVEQAESMLRGSMADMIGRDDISAVSEEQLKASPYYRPEIPFEPGMTQLAWEMRAAQFDDRAYHDWRIQNRNAGFWEGTAGFAAGIAGGLPDPINYIPFGGVAFRTALMARGFGRVGSNVLAQSAEATLATAAVQPYLISRRRQLGEDVGFADAVTDIAMGAIGGALIAGSGPVVRAAWRGGAALTKAGAERFNLLTPRVPAESELGALRILDQAVADTVNSRRIDVGPEAVAAMRQLDRLKPGDEAVVLELRRQLQAKGIEADVVISRPRSSSPSEQRAQRPAETPPPEARAGADLPPSPTPARPSSPVSREAYETQVRRTLERNAAETVTRSQAVIETAQARLRELNRLPDSPEKLAEQAQLREQIESAKGTLQAARRQLRDGVTMPDRGSLDLLHARDIEGTIRSVTGDHGPTPERTNTAVGSDMPDERPDPAAAEVSARPAVPNEEVAGVNLESGDFDELDTYRAAERQGRISAADVQAVKAAEEELRKAKFFETAFEAAAMCLTD